MRKVTFSYKCDN